MSHIYILTFDPANDNYGGGGFYWFPDKETAEESFNFEVQDSVKCGGSHVVRLLRTDNPIPGYDGSDEMGDQVTIWIGNSLQRWELTEPALAQYIPIGTAPDRMPTG